MGITRRQFLKRSAVTAGALLGPSLFEHPFVRRALADTIGDRYLVVLYLQGGNDGLNTVIPVSGALRPAYDAARTTGKGGLNITPSQLGATLLGNDPGTGTPLALHPGLTGFKQLWATGELAVIQGCGYPNYSLSHDESKVIWQTGNPLGVGSLNGTGWLGRHLAANYGATDIPGVTIDYTVAPEYRETATSVLAVPRLADFGFPYDDYSVDDVAAKRQAFADLCASASAGANATDVYIGNSGTAALTSSESYPALHDLYRSQRGAFNDAYAALDTGTARRLREVAKVVYGVSQGAPNVAARFFQLLNDGYDTHSDQGAAETDGQHYLLHREVGDAVKLFRDDLVDMGVWSKVAILVWSEFSRRIPQNDNGTDHGSQGPMFVIGGAVAGGLYGNHPNIADTALDDEGNTVYTQDANPFRSTDFRDVYGTMLKNWVNVPAATILSSLLLLDGGDPASYWTVANFDLGFL
jgi:uncharacterized protein (DUF1501 family)